jgi:hypothetical protein
MKRLLYAVLVVGLLVDICASIYLYVLMDEQKIQKTALSMRPDQGVKNRPNARSKTLQIPNSLGQ